MATREETLERAKRDARVAELNKQQAKVTANKQAKAAAEAQRAAQADDLRRTQQGTRYTQTETPEVNPNQRSQSKVKQFFNRGSKGSSPANPVPAEDLADRPARGGGGKGGGGGNRPPSTRFPGEPRFNPRSSPPIPGLGGETLTKTLGRTALGIPVALGVSDAVQASYGEDGGIARQKEAMNTYGFLAPEEKGNELDLVGPVLDRVNPFGSEGAFNRTLDAIGRMFGNEGGVSTQYQFDRNAQLYRLANDYANKTGENADDLLVDLTRRADSLTSQIQAGTFDPRKLSEEDRQLAIDLGANLESVPSPTTLPPSKLDTASQDDDGVFIGPDGTRYGNETPPFDPVTATARSQEEANRLRREYEENPVTSDNPDSFYDYTGLERPAEPGAIYRSVDDDGVVRYSDTPSANSEQVDLARGTNVSGGFATVNAQQNIQDFPGTASFSDIRDRLDSRRNSFERQQRRARVNQARLYDRARAEIARGDPDLARRARSSDPKVRGPASKALNEYTLQAMQIMQQGRDAFAPQDFDDTSDLIAQDRNEISRERNDLLAAGIDQNYFSDILDFQKSQLTNSRLTGEALSKQYDTALEALYPTDASLDDEIRSVNTLKQSAARTFNRRTGIEQRLANQRLSPQQRSRLIDQSFLGSELLSAFTENNTEIPDEVWNSVNLGRNDAPITALVQAILSGKVEGVTVDNPTWLEAILAPWQTTVNYLDGDMLNDSYVKFANGNSLSLREIAEMAGEYGEYDNELNKLLRSAR